MTSTDQPATFPYSVTCSVCGVPYNVMAESAFICIAAARQAGWQVPDALENKPVLCPTHKPTA